MDDRALGLVVHALAGVRRATIRRNQLLSLVNGFVTIAERAARHRAAAFRVGNRRARSRDARDFLGSLTTSDIAKG